MKAQLQHTTRSNNVQYWKVPANL